MPERERTHLPALIRESLARVPAHPLQAARSLAASVRPAQWFWIGAGALLLVFFVVMTWPRAQNVEAAVIDRGVVRREIVDEGRTRMHDVYVVSAPVSGALQRLTLEPGDPIERGQAVATILPADPALLDARIAAEAGAAVAAAEAAQRAAEASLELARRDHDRVAQLAARGFASPAAVDAAEAALRAARADVGARRADVQRARAAAGSAPARARAPTSVRSPSAGRVLRVLQESEGVVVAGTPILEIGDPADMEIVAEFLSQDAVLMRPGAAASIEGWGGDRALAAHVERIEPYAHTKISALGVEEQRVNVVLRLDHPEEAPPLGHGFRVDARVIVSEQADTIRVPTDALVRNGEAWAVYRIERGRAELTPVEIGEGGERYRAVVGGLDAGDRVVLFPGEALQSGDRVRVTPARN